MNTRCRYVKFKSKNFEWDGKCTKRSALQFTNAVYDPLNCLAPYVVRNRLFLQQLWHLKYDWDESFQTNEVLVDRWKGLINGTCKIVVKQFRMQIAVE